MSNFSLSTYGPDVLIETSLGWFLANQLINNDFPIEYRGDGTTPLNIVNSFAWLDNPEKFNVVRRADFVDRRHQIPLPVVGYGFLDDTPTFFQLGSLDQKFRFTLAILIASESAIQSKNLSNLLKALLSKSVVPIYDYNNVDNKPKIGVIYFEDFISTRFFDYFNEPNLATNFSIGITCDARAELKSSYN
jgi:hypothetical protein